MASANAGSAKFLITAAGFKASDFTVTGFIGVDEISSPYRFDIDFQRSKSSQSRTALTAADILGKPCRFELLGNNGGATGYNGVVREFSVKRRAKPVYAIRLVPNIELLSLNVNNKVFQKLSVTDIVEKILRSAGFGGGRDYRFECRRKYPPITYCVQYRETDLNFISRLMESNGIWYYFEDGGDSGRDCLIITDDFSKFPKLPGSVPFRENAGTSEVSARSETDGGENVYAGGADETIYSLSSRSAIIPKSVRLRTQNYRAPESGPEGAYDTGGGNDRWGHVYEYGGSFKNSDEALRRAELYMTRLKVENLRTEGESVCRPLRAGRLLTVDPGIGKFLLVSVTHRGGIAGNDGDGYAYTYNNRFSCIDSTEEFYAPPLRATPARMDGLMTAKVEATGEDHPSMDEYGNYRVRTPYDESSTEAYGASKDIRLAQPSGGSADGKTYGSHLAVKAGAEMVIAHIDGDPDKPIGIGFVPNAGAQSVVSSKNKDQNVIRTWGGNELVMDDTSKAQYITLMTPSKYQSGTILSFIEENWNKIVNSIIKYANLGLLFDKAESKTDNCELKLDNKKMTAVLRAWMHEISMTCMPEKSGMTLSTVRNEIKMNDLKGTITLDTNKGYACSMELNGNKNKVSISSAPQKFKPGEVITTKVGDAIEDKQHVTSYSPFEDVPTHSVTLDGTKGVLTIETEKGNKIEMEDKGNSIAISNADKTNTVTVDGGNGKITIKTKNGTMIDMDNSKDIIFISNGNHGNRMILNGKTPGLMVKSAGTITIDGKKVNISATDGLNINGKNVNINSDRKMKIGSSKGAVEVKGKPIKLN